MIVYKNFIFYRKKKVILAYLSYFGMKKAIWKGYSEMAVRFYKLLKKFLKIAEVKSSFAISQQNIHLEYMNFILFNKPKIFEKLLAKAKEKNSAEAKIFENKKNILG